MNPLEVLQQANETLSKLESQKDSLKSYLLKNICTKGLSKEDKKRFTDTLRITSLINVQIQYLDKKDKKYYGLYEVWSIAPILDAIQTKGKISYFDIINYKLWKH